MRIVVTGASGNIGTALLRTLAPSGHAIVGIARRQPPDTEPYRGAEWVSVDLAGNTAEAELTDVFVGADVVVHLAWLIQPGRDRELLRRTNQGGTRAVIDTVRRTGVPHLVHVSSVGAYAPAPGHPWVDESWPTVGVSSSSYSVDKAAAERMLDELADQTVALARVRPALVLQPEAASEIGRYFLGRWIPRTLLQPIVLKAVPWPADLRVQFVHAADVADALARIVEQRATGAFNLAVDPVIDRSTWRTTFDGVGPPVPVRAARIAADVSWRARLQPTDAGWIDLAATIPLMKTDRARDVLGWVPTRPADETLRQFVAALRAGQGGTGPLLYPAAGPAERRMG